MDVKRGISGYLIASLLLHLIIGIILLVGVDFSKPKRPESKGQIVNAVMLDENFLNEQAKQIQQQKPKSAAGPTLEGDTALARKQFDTALAAYERAHKLEPSGASLIRQYQVLEAMGRAESMRVEAMRVELAGSPAFCAMCCLGCGATRTCCIWPRKTGCPKPFSQFLRKAFIRMCGRTLSGSRL
jgi:hypothetical protein